MKSLRRLLAGMLLIALPLSPATSAGPPRTPTSPWVVNFADNQCIASREYGTKEKPLTFVLKPSPIGDVIQISVIQKARFSYPQERRVVLQIDGGAAVDADLLAYNFDRPSGKGELRVIRIVLPREDFVPFRSATSLSIRSDPEIDESIALSAMPGLMRQLDACLADLQKHWNILASEEAKLKTKATGSLAQYVNWEDYPYMALKNGEQGTVRFALLINEEGKVADCMITQTSKVPVLDAQTCAVFAQRARFEPAMDMEGRPAKDAVTSQLRWVIPK